MKYTDENWTKCLQCGKCNTHALLAVSDFSVLNQSVFTWHCLKCKALNKDNSTCFPKHIPELIIKRNRRK